MINETEERPEWVKCIQHTHDEKLWTSWCGRDVKGEWTFGDIDHAVYSTEQESRQVPCPGCVAKIKSILFP